MTNEVLTPTSLGGLQVVKIKDRQPFFNGLLYGDSGVGKTHLAGTSYFVPEMSPVIMLDFEGGELTLQHVAPDVERVRIETAKQLDDIYYDLSRGNTGFKTGLFDSSTEYQKFDMYQIMEKVVKESPERDIEVPSIREWGIGGEHVRKVFRYFRDLPMNTIFTALMKTDYDKKKGVTYYMPDLPGKLAKQVPAFLDFVGFMYVKEVDGSLAHLVLTQKTEDTIAKDRSGKLPQVLINPTMADLYYSLTNTSPTGTPPEEAKPAKTVAPVDNDASDAATDDELAALTS
jgi:hypothetical protein